MYCTPEDIHIAVVWVQYVVVNSFIKFVGKRDRVDVNLLIAEY